MNQEIIYKTRYDGDQLQIPGIDRIETIYNPRLKIFEVYVNRHKIKKYVGIQADEARYSEEMPAQQSEIIKINRALRRVYGLTIDDLKVRTRKRKIREPRQVAMTWLVLNTKMTNDQIGIFFKPVNLKAFDCATVIHAKKTILNLLETDKNLQQKYENFDKICKNY